jgi:transcriptional/translational regulatory protein YebC/TACO1
LIVIDAKAFKDEDKVMEAALEAGAEDFKNEGDNYAVITDPTTLTTVAEALKAAGYVPASSDVRNLPKTLAEVDVDTGKKLVRLLDVLEDNDDVQNVWTTGNLTDEMFS